MLWFTESRDDGKVNFGRDASPRSLVATCTALASEDALPKQVEGRLQPSREINPSTIALGRLALALSSGGEAMRPFHGAPSDTDDQKDKLDPSIPDLDCSIDRLIGYFSCYSAPADTEEKADNLFTRLLDELQAALPPDRWRGLKKDPGLDSVRSYTYADQQSTAHIDIDVIALIELEGQNSYRVSIFGWSY